MRSLAMYCRHHTVVSNMAQAEAEAEAEAEGYQLPLLNRKFAIDHRVEFIQ